MTATLTCRASLIRRPVRTSGDCVSNCVRCHRQSGAEGGSGPKRLVRFVEEGGHGARKTIGQVREGLGFVRRTPSLPRKRVTIMYTSWSFGVALMAIYGLMTELWFVPGVRDPERTEADERRPKTDRAAAAAPD